MSYRIILLVIALMLSRNINAKELNDKPVRTLGDVSIIQLPEKESIAPLSAAQLIVDYDELLQLTTDASMIEKLRYRRAQLILTANELAQEAGAPMAASAKGYYDESIETYLGLINDYPQSIHASHLHYQLAKAYDLQGDIDFSYQTITNLNRQYPNNPYAKELHFRSGEYLFSTQKYQQAAKQYQYLVDDIQSPYHQTALYMSAWSHFKLDNTSLALSYFSQLLDFSLPTQSSLLLDIDTLAKGDRQLIGDALDMMAIIFSQHKGAQAITAHYDSVGQRYYEYFVYERLAQQYLVDEGYHDRASTYMAFVTRYPNHVNSPDYAVKAIESYQLGQFDKLAYQGKQDYISRYGINGSFWSSWSVERRAEHSHTLKSYLKEIARDYYRQGQAAQSTNERVTRYSSAANVFHEYIMTFNDDQQIDFLYAESLYASQQFTKAITAYEYYAYRLQPEAQVTEKKRADAAYTALLAYNQLELQGKETSLLVAQSGETISLREQSMLRFVKRFAQDSRHLMVLEQLLHERFEAKRYQDAIASAEQVIARAATIEVTNLIAATLIKAHSLYNLAQFDLASVDYETVLGLLAKTDPRVESVTQSYAASLYEQANNYVARGEMLKAIDWLSALVEKTPNVSLRKVAQFNLAQYLYQAQDYEQTLYYLNDFRTRFSEDKLAKDIPQQVASIYVQLQDWANAAAEYVAISNKLKDTAAQQQPLYLAALYFERAGDSANALITYRRHAHAYPRPFERAVEVRFKLAEIYRERNELGKREFWLKRLILIHDNAGSLATPRSRYLAASSALHFAHQAHQRFSIAKLKLPLRASLKVKKQRLKTALDAYKKSASYQLADIATESTFKMAQIYRQLAKDLMASQRPKGLDALALEQYDILLEEQAYPFEEQAISIYESNTKLSERGEFNQWIKRSFEQLAALLPGRYNKAEVMEEDLNVIY